MNDEGPADLRDPYTYVFMLELCAGKTYFLEEWASAILIGLIVASARLKAIIPAYQPACSYPVLLYRSIVVSSSCIVHRTFHCFGCP